jgi:hypothetical protein
MALSKAGKLSAPEVGQVIRYSYLWQQDALKGIDEGSKDRPCAVILVILASDKRPLVRVLPITHSPPANKDGALELPFATKQRLGLDDERSWILLDEANDFLWPGPDLRPRIGSDFSSVACGRLPLGVMKVLVERLKGRRRDLNMKIVQRTE